MKNQKINFRNKLKSYSALAGTMIAAGTADSQIVYTDISPDVMVNTDGGSYDLDLNNDGTFDFTFNQIISPGGSSSSPYNKVGVTPLNSNMIAGSTAGNYVYPFAMNPGDSIKSSLSWNVGTSQSMGSYWGASYTYGNWPGVNNKYIGLKLDVAGTIYYGWARLDVVPLSTSFTIKDYAFMNIAGQPILAGSLSVGIKENNLSGTTIYNNNHTINILTKTFTDGTIRIMNNLGQEVRSAAQTSNHTIIDLSDLNAGIYFVTIITENNKFTKKIIIN
ncbi:MAG: hypothetical protein K0S44_1927 [Bacteroidetes bacterium]|jgi:hypothetical protein|nr:hypothetical protein [Bacteroidota bacterium]